ncbi:MAG TPA: type II secretion system protein GspG [Blastocatellia bacterium]|nr:type II secretion system protein GspG [Blastocatellia bacterium]
MATQELSKQTCPGCGAKLAASLRYCLHCYHPLSSNNRARAHIESAGAVNTTRRIDPTIVFLPEEHEAIGRRRHRRKLLFVIGAVALLLVVSCSVAWHLLNRNRHEAERAMAREQMAEREIGLMADALEKFRTDVGRYPTNQEGIRSLTYKPAGFKLEAGAQPKYWLGPYLNGIYEVDPWGNDYVYQTGDGGQSFELFSPGPEGTTGSGSRFYVTSPSAPYN